MVNQSHAKATYTITMVHREVHLEVSFFKVVVVQAVIGKLFAMQLVHKFYHLEP